MNTFEISSPIEKIKNYNALLGCIKYKNEFYFYLMPVAWWILDYKKYDPENSVGKNDQFRNSIYVLSEDNKNAFLESIKEDKISTEDIQRIKEYYNMKNENYNSKLEFYISFDDNLYINGFYDIELENYLPEGWVGKFDEPINYLPKELQKLWS